MHYMYILSMVCTILHNICAVNPINNTMFQSEVRFDDNALPTQPRPSNSSSQNVGTTIRVKINIQIHEKNK